MLCSNCRIIEILLEARELATCENGHFLCGKCMQEANDKCMLCQGRIFDNEGNAWIRIQGNEARNWTPEMINDWSKHTEFPEYDSAASATADYDCVLSENGDGGSMNLLYSKGEAYEAESPQDSNSINMDSKGNETLIWNNYYPKTNEHIPGSNPGCSRHISKPYSKTPCIEDKSRVVRKDTRQKLVEQTQEEIREKIMAEIFKSFKKDPRTRPKHEEYTRVKRFQTIGVSTESTPRLLPEERDVSLSNSLSLEQPKQDTIQQKEQKPFKKEPQEYLVLNVNTSDNPNPNISENFKKKNSLSTMNLKLQQVMGTILESVPEKHTATTEDKQFYKFLREKFSHIPLTKFEEIISSIYSERDSPDQDEPCHRDLPLERPPDLSLISNSHRAHYNPPVANLAEITPNPQFQLIRFSNYKPSIELQQVETIDAATLNIPRSPVICPISSCQRAFFVSDFTKHIAVDHTKVPMERILPRQCKNFFLDPKLIHFGVSRCQVLLLVKDKIRNLGHEKFKDFIPILVMTTKVSLSELYSDKNCQPGEEVNCSIKNFFMIWLTGIMPPQLPIFFSLTVWARSGYLPACHIAHSGRLYSVRNSQNPEAVRRSGQMLLLSDNQVELLTNKGRHMLELQITVH